MVPPSSPEHGGWRPCPVSKRLVQHRRCTGAPLRQRRRGSRELSGVHDAARRAIVDRTLLAQSCGDEPTSRDIQCRTTE